MQKSEGGDRELTAALRAVANDDEALGSSAAVEARLRAEVRSIGLAHRRQRYTTVAALAAALLLAVALPIWRGLFRQAPESVAAPGIDAPVTEVATAFLPLIYSNVPVTNAQIIRLDVPRRALASFGLLSIDAMNDSPSGTVVAEVLVGEDGLARAVRFIRPIAHQEQKQ